MAYKYALNAEDAEEITQDVFLQVHSNFNTFRNEAKLKTWIYRITINKSIDFLRSKKRLKNQVHYRTDNEITIHLATQSRNPAQILESDEGIKNLLNCIYQLSPDQQQILILLKMEQKSVKEVAEIIEKSPKAVESMFQRAKSNLKKLLNKSKENE
jgi:RNA polymerase sigma-70 factor (ECF subfamily)